MTSARAKASAIGLAGILLARISLGVYMVHSVLECLERVHRHGPSAVVIYGTVAWEPLAVILLVVISSLHGLPPLTHQLVCTARLLRWVGKNAISPSPKLVATMHALRVVRPFVEVASAHPLAFTIGLLRPRIVVSSGMVGLMSRDELSAVILHEVSHARNLDPLRALAGRGLADFWRWCPILRDWADRHVTRCELAADRHAIMCVGRQPLIGALSKLTEMRAPLGAVAGLHRTAISARVLQLECGHEPRLRFSSGARVSISAVSVSALIVMSVLTVLGYGYDGLDILMHGA